MASGLTSAICDVGKGRGGTWSADGTILFNSVNDGPLLRVAASGGEPAAVTTLDAARQENSHRWPYFLPGGRKFLYLVRTDDHATQGIYVGSLDDPREKTLLVAQPRERHLCAIRRTGKAATFCGCGMQS